jgi:hypothetical protein
VTTGSTKPKRYGLPGASDIQIDRKNSGVTAEITNPYSTPINLWKADAYAIVLDSAGRIIGGGSSGPLTDGITTPSTLKPGAHVKAAFDVTAAMARVARAEVSVNP